MYVKSCCCGLSHFQHSCTPHRMFHKLHSTSWVKPKSGWQHVSLNTAGSRPLQLCTGLKLPLHSYQRHALAWMSWRERLGAKSTDIASVAQSSSQQDSEDAEAAEMFGVGEGAVHPCWQPVTLPSGLHIYENRYTGGTHATVTVAAMSLLFALHTSMQQQLASKACRLALQSAHCGSVQHQSQTTTIKAQHLLIGIQTSVQENSTSSMRSGITSLFKQPNTGKPGK